MDIPDGWGLDGKVALVSGGGAAGDGIGNGRAAAILLAKAGARVVVADRDLKLARRTVEMIESISGQAIAVEVDVTRSTDCASEPGRCRSAVKDHSVLWAVATISA